MIGLDTNILVRYLTQDDAKQYGAVLSLLDSDDRRFFVADLVLLESEWVLTSCYHWTYERVIHAFTKLLQISNLVFENESLLKTALRAAAAGADLSDELILARARSAGCSTFATFDKRIIKGHPDFARLPAQAGG